MDEDTGNVVVFNVNQVSEVSSSKVVEKEGFSPCAEDLEEKGVKISRIGADHHISISSRMAKDFPPTPIINRMCDTSLSGWSKSSQTKSSKRGVRNWPHGYSPFPFTYGGLQEPAMVARSSSLKSGSQC